MTEDEKYDQIIEKMAVLSEPMRIKILLEIASKKELRGKDLLERFSITQPTMSHHMNILTSTGLVLMRKEGRCIWYYINTSTMSEIKELILAISDAKPLRKAVSNDIIPVIRKPVSSTKKKESGTVISSSSLKKKSSVPKPKQAIEAPDIEELKKNKKKKKDKSKDKDNKSDKKKKDKKKKK